MALKDRIKEARSDAGLSQSELARRMNIKRASVSQWEQGLTNPTTENLQEIARLTKRPLEWFLIKDAGEAMRAATAGVMADETVNAIRALPPVLRSIAERKVHDLATYARLMPSWLAKQVIRPPEDDDEYEQWEADIERDMRERLRLHESQQK